MNNLMNSTVTTGFPEGAQNGTFTPDKGKDEYRPREVSPATSAAPSRLTRKRLLALETELSDLDWQILGTICRCRAILGKQIQRLYFTGRASKNASTTAANRRLKALSGLGLIAAVNRKVDCRSRGYVAYIYYLTEAGGHILQIHRHEPEVRKRNIAMDHQALTQKSASYHKVQAENEKFAMRTYLNRIGFIGEEFKSCREHLYKHLDGNAAWRYGSRENVRSHIGNGGSTHEG